MGRKVLIFSFAYYPHVGGAEVAIREITDRLGDIQFDLITYDLGGGAKNERIGNVNVYRVRAFTKYLYPFLAYFKAIKLHLMNRYDSVWAMMANTGFDALFLKLLFPNLKFILTIQEGDPIPQIKRRVWFVYPFFILVFKMADRVTAISNYLAEFSRSMGARQVEVVPNGVDLNKFKIKNLKLKIPEKEKIILVTTSRLVRKNAVDDIIKALKFLPENVIFKCIGPGPDEGSLRVLTKELGLDNRVEFLLYADHDLVSKILTESDIFIRPSLTEGLGISFLEAMAVGLPVIATRVGGIPDFLEDHKTGIFCKVRDPKDLAERVMELIGDRDLYEQISRNAAELIVRKYDWDAIARRFHDIFTDTR